MRYGPINPNFEDMKYDYNSREIHSRIITFDEYKKYVEGYPYSVPHINLTVDTTIDRLNNIALYDEENNKYFYLNKETGYTIPINDITQQLISFMVIDLNNYSLNFSNTQGNAKINYGEFLTPTDDTIDMYVINNKLDRTFHINDPKYNSIEFEQHKFGIVLAESEANKFVKNHIHYNTLTNDNEYIIWGVGNILWIYIEEKNILISSDAYFTGLKFPVKNDKQYTTIVSSVYPVKLKYETKTEGLYNKATALVSKKNVFETTQIKYVNKLFDIDNYIDEYYDFGANSLKQIYINDTNKHGFDITFSECDLKVKVKPTWYNKLCTLCKDHYPLNVNLVIDITKNTDTNIITTILDENLIYNKWELPSNCTIILISEHKNLIEKCSNQNSTTLKYTNTKFRPINSLDDEGLYLSVNHSRNKKEINEDIRDDILTSDDEYIVLVAGRESVKIKKEIKQRPDIPLEYYEEFYLKPHRRKIDEHIRQRVK